MTVVPHIRTLLPDGSLPAESQAFVSQQVQQEAGQYVTDAQAAQAAAEAARDAALAAAAHIIVGAGRPDIPGTLTDPAVADRVAAASSGAVFRSTDGSQGAWEWQKRGSVWVVTSGDTGTRNIDALIGAGWTADRFRIRRRGERVELTLYLVDGSAASSGEVLNLNSQVGWQPSSPLNLRNVLVAKNTTTHTIIRWQTGAWTLPPSSVYFVGGFSTIHYTTDDPWPATLPGTPVA